MADTQEPVTLRRAVAPTPEQIRECWEILVRLVDDGAALRWVAPPELPEIVALFHDLAEAAKSGDAALVLAEDAGRIIGGGYWRRYDRPTHRPHADVERVFVAAGCQGGGIGRLLLDALVDDAQAAGVEVLTLDFRADNAAGERLYLAAGFTEYGRLRDFVAVGDRRYDKRLFARDLRAR